MCLPIVFLHRGNQKYLSIAIHRAIASKNIVYLLGDTTNKKFCQNWIDLDSLNSNNVERFKQAYFHMSSNPKDFEMLCILRYFYIYEFMLQKKISRIILMDSDCLVYKKYSSEEYSAYDCAFGWDFETRPSYICPSSCYWTLEALHNFTEYCLDIYINHLDILKDKWSSYKGHQGGICDLTLLHLWFLTNPPLQILNLSDNKDSLFEFVPAWDHDKKHLYQYHNFTKLLKVKFINQKPHLIRLDNSLQPVDNLHMHGGKKIFMKLYNHYKENGLPFYMLECYRRAKWEIVKVIHSVKIK